VPSGRRLASVPPAPFTELGEHFAIDLPGARAAFTTRRGGHSVGPYASLNLGFATDDDPDAMERNRAALPAAIGSPAERGIHFTYQVHGAEVRRITEDPGLTGGLFDRPRRDGQATNLPGVVMAALVADCLPIAVAGGGAAAMLHAGWRGLEGGMIAAGVRAVRELGEGDQAQLAAAIGPGAGPCCYEVGDEVHEAFAEYAGVRRGDNLDLKEIARRQLVEVGVSAVYDIKLCTLCAPHGLLYSHRRDGGVTGRQAGVAWLT
jgi:purine-nucleoside/S-methyl-5'-thioadenosine phosphorylase / adenosine deaminase